MPNQRGTLRPFTQKITKYKQTRYTATKLYWNNNNLRLTRKPDNSQYPLSRFIVIPDFEINKKYEGQVIHLGDTLDRGRENYHSLLFLKKLKKN